LSLTRHDVAQQYPRSNGNRRRRFLFALLMAPFLMGVMVAPAVAPSPVRGDELSDAQAQQKALEQQIADQKKLIASLSGSEASLQSQIASTSTKLDGVTADLTATRKQVSAMVADVNQIKAAYQTLVNQLNGLDLQLQGIETQEAQKKTELGQRKAELADRIRQAYEAGRTSMLETLLSGASFTDMLAAMSTQLDVAEQDRVLAQQIAQDRATLLAFHQTVEETRAATDTLRQETAVQKQQLDLRLAELKKTQAKLTSLEKSVQATLAAQKAAYAKAAANKAKLTQAMAAAAAAKKQLQAKIDKLVAEQFSYGNIPSQYNGTLAWPMSGTISQDFGCTGFSWEPPYGSCAHYHQGIDLVAPYGTAVRASGAGRVLYCGWNYADGADPAWIVIIAHSSSLTSWYAHMIPGCPAGAGSVVSTGEVIGHEGSTGHSTGAHLHWMIELNGEFVNPRLFT
jgi:murein DD-endopeptidase MepM/ murein hydrolase activator NlpD